MKIVFLCRLYKPHIGGVEKHVEKISNLLAKDHDVTIITEHYGDLPLYEVINTIKIFRIPLLNCSEKSKKWIIWKWLFQHKSILDTADIIHCHDVVFWLYIYKLLNPFKKIFATFHGWEGIYPIPVKNKLKRQFDAKISAGNICIGSFIEKWYGIKANYISYGAVDKFKVSKKPKNILLYLGRLDKDTALEECLIRYERLKPKLKWSLSIVGDGLLKRFLPTDAKFYGWVLNFEDYVAESKYVYASGYLSILEAMSAGRTVLSSFDNPVREDYLKSHPMAKYISFTDQFRTNLPQEAVEWARAQTWEKLADIYSKLWHIK